MVAPVFKARANACSQMVGISKWECKRYGTEQVMTVRAGVIWYEFQIEASSDPCAYCDNIVKHQNKGMNRGGGGWGQTFLQSSVGPPFFIWRIMICKFADCCLQSKAVEDQRIIQEVW